MQDAAIYARYSTQLQREASIEDQVRRSREAAIQKGFIVPDDLIFSDAAISGESKAASKRVGWQALLRAWDERRFAAVFVDEISRIARDQLELAKVSDKVRKTGVRLITADGIDSDSPQFALVFGISSAIASYELDEIRFRVQRGMRGQLERGYMCAAAPYAYTAHRIVLEDGKEVGTRWLIDEEKAGIVRRIFADRVGGLSLAEIARRLNSEGLPTSRRSRREPGEPGRWLPGTVHQLLGNTIYRGVMTWNGSVFARTRARKERRALTPVPYAFPTLRIVEDEVWHAANARVGRAIPGTGRVKSIFSGLVNCGPCNGTLCMSTGGSRDSYCCHNCMSRHSVGAQTGHPGYFTEHALKLAVTAALEQAFDPSAIEVFRDRLLHRLTHGAEEELEVTEKALAGASRRCTTLLDVMETVDRGGEEIKARYSAAVADRVELEMRRDKLIHQCRLVSREILDSQLVADPRPLIPRLFEGEVPKEKVRQMLASVCPRIIYLGKPWQFAHEFQIDVATGQAVAEFTESEPIDRLVKQVVVRVTATARRPTTWTVEVLQRPTGKYLSVGKRD